ncbi:prealbumin-like fold domain-containing protein [uncultured Corynebacterium sp.]|uniref:prealbumin-like fold domain-containing protein n=1 Tax=uncultured Corynebacterium sp. TaxID=159447 RepID=UPI0025D6A668|nr:prealbumin-like fold domain-containing protein [uncultured Corynebacterium sp.]
MRKNHKFAALVAASLMIGTSFTAGLADAKVISGNDGGLIAEAVDTQRLMTLTVRKVAKNPYDDVPAGEKPAAISGAVFTLSRVNGVDVLTRAGRAEAKEFTLEQARENGVTEVAKRTTNDKGVAEFTELKPGLYLLEESAPDGDYDYHLSSPKLVILPLGNVTGEEFDYENVIVTKPDNQVPPPDTPPTTSTTTTTTTTTSNTPPPPGDSPTPETTPVPPETTPNTPPGDTPTDGGSRPPLASTGANVLWALGFGGLLIIAGFFLARRNNDKQTQ